MGGGASGGTGVLAGSGSGGRERWDRMPQKTSSYPPIHDQIDTPTDFSVAVWEERGRGVAEERRRQVTERSRARTRHARVKKVQRVTAETVETVILK